MGETPTRQKGELLNEGKTKKIWTVEGDPTLVIVENKDDLTAGDGAKHDVIVDKGALANATNSNVMRLLAACGLPVAFVEKIDDTHFLGKCCDMIAYEVVARREAHGSYVKRHPHVAKGTLFPCLEIEFYLKTSGKKWGEHDLPKDDPLIHFSKDGEPQRAKLFRPDLPIADAEPFLILEDFPLDENPDLRAKMEHLTRHAFLILERAWSILGRTLVDLKVEFGITPEGELLLADVIDNDSWRVMEEGNYIDKQRYRDGADLNAVTALYKHVAELTGRFDLPASASSCGAGPTRTT